MAATASVTTAAVGAAGKASSGLLYLGVLCCSFGSVLDSRTIEWLSGCVQLGLVYTLSPAAHCISVSAKQHRLQIAPQQCQACSATETDVGLRELLVTMCITLLPRESLQLLTCAAVYKLLEPYTEAPTERMCCQQVPHQPSVYTAAVMLSYSCCWLWAWMCGV